MPTLFLSMSTLSLPPAGEAEAEAARVAHSAALETATQSGRTGVAAADAAHADLLEAARGEVEHLRASVSRLEEQLSADVESGKEASEGGRDALAREKALHPEP